MIPISAAFAFNQVCSKVYIVAFHRADTIERGFRSCSRGQGWQGWIECQVKDEQNTDKKKAEP